MKMKKLKIVSRGLAVTALAITALTISADDSTKGGESSTSSSKKYSQKPGKEAFIKESAQLNMATVKFAELANEKAQNPQLKQYGQKLAQERKQTQQQLEQIAQKHNVTLPTSVDDKCQQEITRLQGLSGQEFDREFAKGAVEGHAMAVAQLQQAGSSATDTDVRQFTQTLLAKVKEHQREAREIARAVGVDATTISALERKAQDSVGGPASSETSSGTDNPSSAAPKDPSKQPGSDSEKSAPERE